MKPHLELNEELRQDTLNLGVGLFAPLKGFLSRKDYEGVLARCELADGSAWTIPVTLDADLDTWKAAKRAGALVLTHQLKPFAELRAEDCFEADYAKDLPRFFGTKDKAHPRFKKELLRHRWRIGGRVKLLEPAPSDWLDPAKMRAEFARRGWKTVAGFQTRNPVHRAHEHLQRVALDLCDGLFINPLLGWKRPGDFSDLAVLGGYAAMVEGFYPADRVYFAGLRTHMRYGGPREAVFHALIRRNLGCTHFVVGRDHAGVGGYYGRYEAQQFALNLESRLGIKILGIQEPYHCRRCAQIVTRRHCGHADGDVMEISGTLIRKALSAGKNPPAEMMRVEVAAAINSLGAKKFIGPEDA